MTEQDVTTGAAADAVEVITTDHRVVEQLYEQFKAAVSAGDLTVQRDAAEAIIRELSIHAMIEEQVLYPAMKRELPDGERIVEHDLAEHQKVKEGLAELDGMTPEEPGFGQILGEVMSSVMHHAREEEEQQLPQLRQKLGQEQLSEMGRTLERIKGAAPTRPHPNAPDEPPGNLVAGPVAALLDKARDAARRMSR